MNPGATPPPGGRAADGAGAARGSTDAVPVRRVPPRAAARSMWTYFIAAGSTFYYGMSVILSRLSRSERWMRRANRATAEWSSAVLRGAGVRTVLENAQHLGNGRGQVLVCNHQSWFDVFALSASLPVEFSFVGKKELSRVPVLGQAWEKVGHVAIDRSDRKSAIESLKRVEEQFRAGRTIIMFPEGTRSPTGELARFKKGAFVMAIKCQVPVVPVAVSGTGAIMSKGDWVIEPGTATIRVGSPISTRGLTQRDRNRLTRDARAAVVALMNGRQE